MARISEEEINAVRSRADIVQVIGHYLPVTRKGKSYVALCPFHDDHDPSLSISPDKQIYKCFVCGAGGNVFTFVQNYEKVSFPEAVAKVADLVGYPLSVDVQARPESRDPHLERLQKILEETISFAMYQMSTAAGETVRNYCLQRGLDDAVRETFQIGWIPGGDALYAFLHAKGYSDADMVEANVVRTSTSGLHDVFQERITFPIHDGQGRAVGFSARTLDPRNPAKYLNTNDTPLFHKGSLVYNLHRARFTARRQAKIYLCEGVTDVIAFSRAGMENAVCTLGTACTEQQIRLLKAAAPKLVFCYDGDQAGQNATWRAAKLAMKNGCKVSIVRNTTGKDPDEILRDGGPEALQQLAHGEESWMEFALAYLQSHTNLENYEERKEFVRRAQAEIEQLEDPFDRQHFTEEVARISGFPLTYTPEQKKTGQRRIPNRLVQPPVGTREAEEQLLAQMLAHPEAAACFTEHLGYLPDEDCEEAAMLIVDARRQHPGEPLDVTALMNQTDKTNVQELFARMATSRYYEWAYDESIVRGDIRKILIGKYTAKADAFREQLAQTVNTESRLALISEYQQCLLELRRLIDEENSN